MSKSTYVTIAEKVLGKSLPKGAIVHHLDLDRSNNRNNNLVICQDRKFHALLHNRTSALHPPTASDIQAQLSLWTVGRWAKELGVLRSSITVILNGYRPHSVLIPRIARKLKVSKEALRSYLVDVADRREHARQAAIGSCSDSSVSVVSASSSQTETV